MYTEPIIKGGEGEESIEEMQDETLGVTEQGI